MGTVAAAAAELAIGIEGHLGVIALNRPERINALTLAMVRGIYDQLQAWRDDAKVRAVLFEGRGAKGFCAGGDVRAVREAVNAGEPERGLVFLADEYRMNRAIASFPKPVVALCSGIVMGGGIGIAGHASFRFAAEGSRFAMPESAIGFVCDVGSNAILARAPPHRALLFMMSGAAVGGADALALGLTDCVFGAPALADVRAGIVAAATAGEIETALVSLMQAQGLERGDPTLGAAADLVAEELTLLTAREIMAGLKSAGRAYPTLAPWLQILETRSPTSLEAIVQGQRAARRIGDLDAILALELRLARFLAVRPDFDNGVRAVLVDHNVTALKWSPADFDDEVARQIAAEIAAIETTRKGRLGPAI